MSAEIQVARAKVLGAELARAMDSLSRACSARAASLFVDRLARCEALSAATREEAGLGRLVEAAREVRRREAKAIAGCLDAGLDYEGLAKRAALLDGAPGEQVLAWGEDVLVLANVQPWLGESARRRAAAILEREVSRVAAVPERFAVLKALARDRLENERPKWSLNPHLVALVEAFSEAGEPAAETVPKPSAEAEEIARKVLGEAQQLTFAGRVRRYLDRLVEQFGELLEVRTPELAASHATEAALPESEKLLQDEEEQLLSLRVEGRDLLVMVAAGHSVECRRAALQGGGVLQAEVVAKGMLRIRDLPVGRSDRLAVALAIDGEDVELPSMALTPREPR